MRRSVRWTLFASVVTALAMFLAACGGNDDNGGGGGSSQSGLKEGTQIQEGKQGGALTILAAGDVDYVDPGQTYYQFGYQVAYAVNRTLYAFKPDNSVTPIPDLADGEPEISADSKTITVKLKKGIKYAPPVNREVKAADIKYAIERAFSKEVPSGYAGTYFNSIVGTPEKANSADPKDISGIETPDDFTIVLKLKSASAPLVSQALVMPITTPVPKEYAAKYDKSTPSKYNQYVAFTGPYMIKNDPQSGKLTGWTPGKQIQMVRNPNWNKATDFRPAYLDSITIQEGNQDLTTATRRTFTGKGLVCCGDSASPPAPVLKQAVQRYKDQVFFAPSGGTRYIAFNTTVKPLDNINVRKAIIAGTNRDALRLTRGGAVLGDIANGWLPPDFPGFKESGGLKQNTDLDYLKNPKGDPAVSKKYMLAAKQDDPSLPIDANGKWTGTDKILTVADSADPSKTTAEVFQGQLEQLGFKLNFRVVPRDTMYTKFCQEPEAKVAICPSVGWFKDFSDPQSMLDATFNGNNILAHGNVNWPQLDVPAINNAMKEASTVPVGTERNDAWAKVNHMITEQAPGVPYIWDKSATVAATDVQLVQNGYWSGTDPSYTSLK
jgi:peptide/nickel transport system substrate-binding protein